MNERIGVGLYGLYAVVLGAIGTTIFTFAIFPSMLAAVVAQIALYVAESRSDAVFTIGLLGAVERAAAHLGGEVGAGNSEDLLGHNVVDALLQVRNLLFETR